MKGLSYISISMGVVQVGDMKGLSYISISMGVVQVGDMKGLSYISISMGVVQVGDMKGLSYISISKGVVLGCRRQDMLLAGRVFPYTPALYAGLYLLLNTTYWSRTHWQIWKQQVYMPRRKPNENYCSMHRHFPEVLHFQQEVQEKAWERKHAPPTLRQQRHSQPLPGVKGLQDLRWQPDEWKDATLSHICDFSTSQLLLWHCNHASGKQHSPRIKWNNQGPVLPACVPQRSWQGTSALAKFSRMMPVSTLIHTVWAVQLQDSWLCWRGWGCPQRSNETCELNWFSVHLLLFKTYIYIIHTNTGECFSRSTQGIFWLSASFTSSITFLARWPFGL